MPWLLIGMALCCILYRCCELRLHAADQNCARLSYGGYVACSPSPRARRDAGDRRRWWRVAVQHRAVARAQRAHWDRTALRPAFWLVEAVAMARLDETAATTRGSTAGWSRWCCHIWCVLHWIPPL